MAGVSEACEKAVKGGDAGAMMDFYIVATLLEHNDLVTAVEVDAEHFGSPQTQIMFKAVMEALGNAGAVDLVLLAQYLPHEYPTYDWQPVIDELSQAVVARKAFVSYQEKLKTDYANRRVKNIARKLGEDCDISKALDDLRNINLSPSRNGYDPERISRSFIENLENPPHSISSGIPRIDSKLGGFHGSDLIVLGARPSMGKTALAVNFALGCNHPFLFFSGEQGATQLMERMVAIHGRIPLWKMRNRSLSTEEYRGVTNSVAELRQSNFYVVDKPAPTLQDILTESRKQTHGRGVKMIIVDYLQRMRTTGDSRREAVEAAVRGLKELARELDVPVIVLAQVNRAVDSRENKHPQMGDLLESGSIEAEADQVIMLSREHIYDKSKDSSEAIITIEKNRHGPTGKVEMHFEAETLRFREVA